MRIKFKEDVFERIIKTILQTLTSVIVANSTILKELETVENTKQYIYGVALVILSGVLCALMNIELPPIQKGNGKQYDTFSDYVKSIINKKIDFDKCYDVQCVDLIDHYISYYLNLEKGFYGNAKEWALEYNNSEWLKQHFDLIKIDYSKKELPALKQGDIGIRTNGKYGHIFLIDNVKGNIINTPIKYIDENGGGKHDKVTYRRNYYNSYFINYVLRPKMKKNNKTMFKANATIISKDQYPEAVYIDNGHNGVIGFVGNNERIKVLASGKINSIIQYHINDNTGYKVGIIKNKYVKKD